MPRELRQERRLGLLLFVCRNSGIEHKYLTCLAYAKSFGLYLDTVRCDVYLLSSRATWLISYACLSARRHQCYAQFEAPAGSTLPIHRHNVK